MKEFLSFLWKILRRLLEKELKSPPGKVNLIGGILGVALLFAIIAHNLLTKVLNSMLSVLGKPLLPEASDIFVVAGIVFILTYFYYSVKVIKKNE